MPEGLWKNFKVINHGLKDSEKISTSETWSEEL
jgi:hypothetical protein